MAESESAAVPLGDTPILSNSLYGMAGVPGLEPGKWRDQNPLPYHLAIPLFSVFNVWQRGHIIRKFFLLSTKFSLFFLTKDLKTSKIAYKCFVFSNLFLVLIINRCDHFLSLNEAFDLVWRLILKKRWIVLKRNVVFKLTFVKYLKLDARIFHVGNTKSITPP